jgi:hypothetical protein
MSSVIIVIVTAAHDVIAALALLFVALILWTLFSQGS